VLVLHGFLEQGLAWERVAVRLDRRVVAPDQRGHGLSDAVGAGGWYHFWDYAGDVDALVTDIAGPAGQVDLVGHSMGGTVACLYAGTAPERVRRLVLVEGLGPPDTTEFAVSRAREYLRDRRDPPSHSVLRDLDDGVARLKRGSPGLDDDTARALVSRVTTPVDGGLRWTWDPLHRGRTPNPFATPAFLAFLREIRAPVLLLDGGRSGWVPPDQDQRIAAIPTPVTRDVVPNAGHLVHHDDPEGLADRIRAFLDA
jgi:pimeloyl-ACP methyl ester carboxylesterase